MPISFNWKPRVSQFLRTSPTCEFSSRTFSTLSHSTEKGDASPVSLAEFLHHLQGCRPTETWPEKIGVAFSGGPDSTALLYLLKRICSEVGSPQGLPRHIVALTVDHGLQATSSHMTEQCSDLATFLRVKHMRIKIPWNTPPFPPLPEKGAAFEKIAREARYHVLLEAMEKEQISIIAFGHHADDQVETALLRLSRGSSELGAAGMRPCRRWGMGFGNGPRSLGWAGHLGLNKWIIRLVLRFPKSRLIETCVANGLNYVQDSTNFQPHLTPRNYIRHTLKLADDNKNTPVSPIVTEVAEKLIRMVSHSANISSASRALELPEGSKMDRLRTAVNVLSDTVMLMEKQVSRELKNVLKPSPISTALLSLDDLSAISDNAIRLGIVRRILRYVSPFPWGSPRAEAGGRSASLQKIVTRLWEETQPSNTRTGSLATFAAGASVLWSPVVLSSEGSVKYRTQLKPSERRGWIASRQPPLSTLALVDSDSQPAGIAGVFAASPLEHDITSPLTSGLRKRTRDTIEVLYDCRFLIRVNVHELPPFVSQSLIQSDDGGVGNSSSTHSRLLIVPHSKYFLPKLVLHLSDQGTEREIEVATLREDGVVDFPILENNKSASAQQAASSPQIHKPVSIEWIRPLDADIPNNNPSIPV